MLKIRPIIRKNLRCVRCQIDDFEEEDLHVGAGVLKDIVALNKKEWPCLFFGIVGGLILGATWPVFSVLLSNVIGVSKLQLHPVTLYRYILFIPRGAHVPKKLDAHPISTHLLFTARIHAPKLTQE